MAFYTVPYDGSGNCCTTCPTVQSCDECTTTTSICEDPSPCSLHTQPSASAIIGSTTYTVPFLSTSGPPYVWTWSLTLSDSSEVRITVACNPVTPGLMDVSVSVQCPFSICAPSNLTLWLASHSDTDLTCTGTHLTGSITGIPLIEADCFPDISFCTPGTPVVFTVDVTFP